MIFRFPCPWKQAAGHTYV